MIDKYENAEKSLNVVILAVGRTESENGKDKFSVIHDVPCTSAYSILVRFFSGNVRMILFAVFL